MYKVFTIVLFSLLICACDLEDINGDETKEETVGPCFHANREPVIHLNSVYDLVTEEDIQQVVITNIVYENEAVTFQENNKEMTTNIFVDFESDKLFCILPCAFLTSEGSYEFTVSASGYNDEMIEVDASYSVFDGGCPSYVDGGTELDLELTKTEG